MRLSRVYRLFVFACFLGLTACCTKVGCPSDRIEVSLSGLDTTGRVGVRVYNYAANTGFLKAKDSFYTQAYYVSYNNQDRFELPATMTYKDDLRILLDSPAQVFEVSGFVMDRAVCNHCYGSPDEYYFYIKSYLLNGKRVESRQIVISK